ncbi:hypothetical protein IPF89_02375 [Candidatus Saccharibacteria bacterium]|nr:hypothetical protein [Candidatus Saccharimonas aalborgensis]QQR51647.1 MAG: hypothetical protein IPF89_02375 [Candidatus Saccharibacteria bacterium]
MQLNLALFDQLLQCFYFFLATITSKAVYLIKDYVAQTSLLVDVFNEFAELLTYVLMSTLVKLVIFRG